MTRKLTFNLPTKYDCGGFTISNTYIDLNWSTQREYTLPANGIIVVIGRSSGTDCWLSSPIKDKNNNYQFSIEVRGTETDTLLTWITPILEKGWKVGIDMHNLKTQEIFRFFYIEGQPSIIKY